MKSVILVLTSALVSVALAAPPAAPTITVAASNIKQLQFDITPVTGVNWYELWFKANAGAQWVNYAQTPAQRPRFRIGISVHLLDWQQARFFVKACNPSSCSQSNEVGVFGQQFAAMGYFKPTTTQENQFFGDAFAVSGDGMTMAVNAQQKIVSGSGLAVLHIFRKASAGSGWSLDARLLPKPDVKENDAISIRDAIAVSRDGKLVVFANSMEYGNTGGVYLFRRDETGWRQAQRIVGHSPDDMFGINVKLDSAGKTLVIEHNQDGGLHREGTLDVYQDPDDGSDQFVFATKVRMPEVDDVSRGWCRAIALSDAGHIARVCYTGNFVSWTESHFTQVLTATSSAPLQYVETARLPGGAGDEVALDSAGKRLLVQDLEDDGQMVTNPAVIYRRDSSGWVREGTLLVSPSALLNHSAISGDGKIVALGSPDDTHVGRGPLFPPYQMGIGSGTVAVYELRASGWALRRFLKPDRDRDSNFGSEVALDQNGHTLAVGAPYDTSNAIGIDGDRDDDSSGRRGAVWLY